MKIKTLEDNINLEYTPIFFRLNNAVESKKFEELIKNNSYIQIIDEIDSQLEELIKLKYPKKKLSQNELKIAVQEHLNGISKSIYGVWVFYPWLNKIVHLLDEKEFVEVRTNRNHYKITPKEEHELSTKKVGIIGLSVGKAIATTIAMERICGEIVLADFDVIELSNLNRIQTGVFNFNIKKTVVAAREIAEFDPFIKVTCYHDGLTEQNINDFFTKNGKLDICIEVCDGLTSKIFARHKAKELGIPVLMNSSDRGTTDIERYDLDKNLPILHGLIDHLDISKLKQAKTNEEKVPYLLPMLGVETSSNRLKASMLEIEETITTWPQLSSGVVLGGAICTDVCRRVLLNQFNKSGRYFLDIEDHINNNVSSKINNNEQKNEIQKIPNTSIADYDCDFKKIDFKIIKDYCDLNEKEITKLVELASLAPSGGNIQPWKWIYKNKTLLLFIDKNRTKSTLNFQNVAALISNGAAGKNLEIAANELGYSLALNIAHDEQNNLVAKFNFIKKKVNNLFSIPDIKNRITNRTMGDYKKLNSTVLSSFQKIQSSNNSLSLKLFESKEEIKKIQQILMKVDKLYYTSKIGHNNFMNELRWTKKENEITRDGVDIETIDLTPTEKAGFIVSKNWEVVKHLNEWNLGKSFSKLTEKGLNCASAIGIIIGPKEINQKNYFDAGVYLQSLWLNSTQQKVSFQPMSISSFLFAGAKDNPDLENISSELVNLEKEFNKICQINNNKRSVFIFRLAKVQQPKVKSLRRPIKDVLIYN